MTRHTKISFIKSALRFAACASLWQFDRLSAGLLIAAEVLGVWEEIGL